MSKFFLSCVSAEFPDIRDQLVRDLRRPNVEVKAHEEVRDFNSGLTTLEKLDDYIHQCSAVIHLTGDGTGAEVEAPQVEAIERRYPDLATTLPALAPLLAHAAAWRGSYTQWEAYLAIYHIVCGRLERCLIYHAADTAPRAAGFSADDTGRRLQAEHVRRLEALGRDRVAFASREDLRVQVLNHLLDLFSRRSEPLKAEPSRLWKLQTRPDSVFEGRERVLADLDALWADALADKAARAQIVSLVAIGGAGKTTVASRWKDALLARDGHGGVERYFDWSFYSQGTRGEADNANAQTAADATVFCAAALTFFGDVATADSAAPAWDKGARLATLVAQYRTLLILDGLEPLQHPPGPQTGELKDDTLRALFAGLLSTGRGLCVVTTRERITDLAATDSTTTRQWPLDHLTDLAGVAVLRGHGVTGPQNELEAASRGVKGHALTLALMGRYLALAFDPPDIARRDCFEFAEADDETHNGHAFRVFAAYERWFEGKPVKRGWFSRQPPQTTDQTARAILRLLGLFDRPATPDCLAALCAAPAIPGLTEPLVGLGEQQWNAALARLREIDLVETVEWSPLNVSGYGKPEARAEMAAGQQRRATNLGVPQPFEARLPSLPTRKSLDAHPLLREYFAAQLSRRGSAAAGHARLYEHLCASVPFWPEGRDGLLPLYQAVAHGCKAGRLKEACAVYRDRIKRGTAGRHAFYSDRALGLFGLDLAAVACFFIELWRRVAPDLNREDQSWLLNQAGYSLRALNRLAEAREPLGTGIELDVEEEAWSNAATGAGTLSELELTLGEIRAAERTAARSVSFAVRGGPFEQLSGRARQADVLHKAGRRQESRVLFAKAEAIQAERQPGYHLLYSKQGYFYCDFLLTDAESAGWQQVLGTEPDASKRNTASAALTDVERRAQKMLEWRVPGDSLITMALDDLTRGRVLLLGAIVQHSTLGPSSGLLHARRPLETALAALRRAGTNYLLPNAQLPLAWLHALAGEWDDARERLDEAFAVATRGGNAQNGWQGGMRLHLVDTLLHRARLFGRLKDESRRMKGAAQPPETYLWPGRTPQMDLAEAAALISACGYHRRDEELADAIRAIT